MFIRSSTNTHIRMFKWRIGVYCGRPARPAFTTGDRVNEWCGAKASHRTRRRLHNTSAFERSTTSQSTHGRGEPWSGWIGRSAVFPDGLQRFNRRLGRSAQLSARKWLNFSGRARDGGLYLDCHSPSAPTRHNRHSRHPAHVRSNDTPGPPERTTPKKTSSHPEAGLFS